MRKLLICSKVLILVSAVALTAGCLPRWAVGAGRYAVSDILYSAEDPGQAVMIAAEGFTFLVLDVEVTNNGDVAADIKDDLIFAVYDEAHPADRYENFYEDGPFELFGAIQEAVLPDGKNSGAIFFTIPDALALSGCIFKTMLPSYDVLYSVRVDGLSEVTDYPGSW